MNIFFFFKGTFTLCCFLTAIDYCLHSFGFSDSVGCDADVDDRSVFCRKNDDIHNMAETIFLRFTFLIVFILLPGISIKICVLFNLDFPFNIFSVVCLLPVSLFMHAFVYVCCVSSVDIIILLYVFVV